MCDCQHVGWAHFLFECVGELSSLEVGYVAVGFGRGWVLRLDVVGTDGSARVEECGDVYGWHALTSAFVVVAMVRRRSVRVVLAFSWVWPSGGREIGIAKRIWGLYGDFSGRSDSRFCVLVPGVAGQRRLAVLGVSLALRVVGMVLLGCRGGRRRFCTAFLALATVSSLRLPLVPLLFHRRCCLGLGVKPGR